MSESEDSEQQERWTVRATRAARERERGEGAHWSEGNRKGRLLGDALGRCEAQQRRLVAAYTLLMTPRGSPGGIPTGRRLLLGIRAGWRATIGAAAVDEGASSEGDSCGVWSPLFSFNGGRVGPTGPERLVWVPTRKPGTGSWVVGHSYCWGLHWPPFPQAAEN